MTNQEAIIQFKYAIDLIKQDGKDYLDERDIPMLDMAIEALENQKIGHWVDNGLRYDVVCSICNTQYPLKPISSSRLMGCKSNYCPGCGAKMVETQESEELKGENK